MVEINLYDNIIDKSKIIFVDIVAKYRGQWVLCKGKSKGSWECPGGHIENGETPEQASKRELWEETGAIEFDIKPVGYYGAKGSDGVMESVEEVFGQIYYADIKVIGELPDFEIEKIELFKELPNNWTYSYAHPMFIDLAEKFMFNSINT
ncbi:NUDIX hydrolase [Candidatus Clostridium radicumherbarum]|uniref:NUDIX domain-containing protein n=1 Tax=Candidatus Clostridium radicumherbarum TaxID=3381662 RepID=A0ABW8TS42_9CLOT